jgi:acylpyruvate hydrolase
MASRNFISVGRKIVAIGRNYSEHAKELGNAVPTAPFFFLKPTSSRASRSPRGVRSTTNWSSPW